MTGKKFNAKLEAGGEGGAWVILKIPFSVEQVFGTKGRVSVRGTINGFPYRSSIFPSGDGTHAMLVNKAMQKGAQAGDGDRVRVEMELDTEPRTVVLPTDLESALARHPRAKAAYERLSPSRKKLLVDSIESAKKPETREKRISKTVEELGEANG